MLKQRGLDFAGAYILGALVVQVVVMTPVEHEGLVDKSHFPQQRRSKRYDSILRHNFLLDDRSEEIKDPPVPYLSSAHNSA